MEWAWGGLGGWGGGDEACFKNKYIEFFASHIKKFESPGCFIRCFYISHKTASVYVCVYVFKCVCLREAKCE